MANDQTWVQQKNTSLTTVMGKMRTVRITGRTIMPTMVMGIMTRTGMAVTSRRRRVGCVSGSPWKECGSDARYLLPANTCSRHPQNCC